MSRAARRTSNSVSLFPFLAVLVCAMGALIFLLLVITRRIRDDVRERVVAERPPAAVIEVPVRIASGPPLVPPLPGFAPPPEPEPIPEPDPEPEPLRPVEPVFVADPEPPPPDPNIALRATIRDLEVELEKRRSRALRARSTIDATEAEVAAVERDVESTRAELERQRRKLEELLADAAALQSRRAHADREYEALGERLRLARQKERTETSEFAFVPYDGATGTSRRPIYIECTEDGLRFQPEDVLLTEQDLIGFTFGYNPLLAGTKALVEHFDGVDRRENPTNPRPYVLLVVRPGGEASYYAARRLLEQLGEPFGYELVPGDFELAAGEPDPIAKKLVVDETNRLLASREAVMAQVMGRGGPGGGGGDGTDGLRGGVLEKFPSADSADPLPGRGNRGETGTGEGTSGRSIVGLNRPPVGIGSPLVGIRQAPPSGGHVVREYPPRGDGDRPGDSDPDRAEQGTGVRTADVRDFSRDPRGESIGPRMLGSERPREQPLPRSNGLIDPEAEKTDDVFPSIDDIEEPLAGPKPDDVFQRATRGHPSESSRHPGGHPALSRSGIGFERSVPVEVYPDRMIVNDRYVMQFERGQSSDDLATAVLTGVERATAAWGTPPRGFHWVPSIAFHVQPGGSVQFERIRSRLSRSRLKTTVEYAGAGVSPTGGTEGNDVQNP